MRLPVLRLIALRETRDLLRDRRTVMLILVMPAVLYPFFGIAGYLFALSVTGQKTVIGLVGEEHLNRPPFPPLVAGGTFAEREPEAVEFEAATGGTLSVLPVTGKPAEALRAKTVDAVIVIPKNVFEPGSEKPVVKILDRDADEKSKQAAKLATAAVRRWHAKLREVHFTKAGLPKDFDTLFKIEDPQSTKSNKEKAAVELRDQFVKVFPFILMMWLLAGAIQPAVDLTAGEKERGTMETLLISPAERTEIVFGKFLATTFFAFASVLWNVLWLTGGAFFLGFAFGSPVVYLPGLLGCVVLGLPMAMLFSAVCIALGVFARSTKEGQYYLMPLILVTMPLAVWSMMPGQELDFGTALVPVTGAMLLQQKLLATTADPTPWTMFGPVIGGLTIAVTFALWLAVRQFKREDVLFREVGGDKGGRLGRLFSS